MPRQGLLHKLTHPLGKNFHQSGASDPDELRYPATICVWTRWYILAVCLVQLLYRPVFTPSQYLLFSTLLLIVISLNFTLHLRLHRNRPITRPLLFTASVIDIIALTTAGGAAGGFQNFFFHLVYYPALAMIAMIFPSFRLGFAFTTIVAAVYTTISITVGEGLELEARDEKALFGRVAVMYAVVAAVTLVSRFEQDRRRKAVERERQLESERIAVSQNIHNTIAQSAFMIGLGIETARELADPGNTDLVNNLNGLQGLATSTMWELRHPIDMGLIFQGRDLSQVIRSHTDNFTAITSIPTQVNQAGNEPPLAALTKGAVFSIAHNALTNAFRHSRASLVTLTLEFRTQDLRMSISDDGSGLPDDYLERGHGFRNMQAEAESIGSTLEVESPGPGQGTTVTCTVPYEQD